MKYALIGIVVAAVVAAAVALLAASCVATSPSGAGSVDASGAARDPGEILAVGDPAPAFTSRDHRGNAVRLADYRGKQNVVLIFYPGDDTPGCTKQLCTARDDYSRYEGLDAVVFGVNPADAESHAKFAEKYDFPFGILVDSDGAVIRAYGCRGIGGITTRTVYVIDKAGRIAFAERGMPATDDILAALKG